MEEKKCSQCKYSEEIFFNMTCLFCKKHNMFDQKDTILKINGLDLSAPKSKKLVADKIITGTGKAQTHIDICRTLTNMYIAKNKDYGDSFSKSFKEYGMMMPCIRLEDKLNRLKSLTKNQEQKVNDESIEDTLKDLANYAIMTLIELREDRKE